MRIYDRILFDGVTIPPLMVGDFGREAAAAMAETCIERMEESVVFDIQNVSDYMITVEERSPAKRWDWMQDFPNVALPYDAMWFEYRHPSGERIGVLANAMDETGFHIFEFMLRGGAPIGPFRVLRVFLNLDGTVSRPPEYIYPINYDDLGVSDILIAPVFMAISFLHCKNVAIEDAPFIGPRQQRRALERKGIKQAKFKTLVIEPMKQVLKTEGGIETNGLKKAMHICRGHFATYSEDKPLFGKYSGTFWRPAHVRGNADNGTVYKDYKVKAPKD